MGNLARHFTLRGQPHRAADHVRLQIAEIHDALGNGRKGGKSSRRGHRLEWQSRDVCKQPIRPVRGIVWPYLGWSFLQRWGFRIAFLQFRELRWLVGRFLLAFFGWWRRERFERQ